MNAQCFWLSSQSGQTQITVGQKHWRWCGAGSPSALMVLLCVALVVLLCVWCVAGIGARAHQEREERYSIFILRPPKLVRMRVRVRIRVTHLRGVGERPHVRWSVERTASLAVAKPRCSGGQTRWTCELSGLCKVYNPKR